MQMPIILKQQISEGSHRILKIKVIINPLLSQADFMGNHTKART